MRHPSITFTRLTALPQDTGLLAAKARAEGLRFIVRLVAEFQNGANTFSRPGEVLLGAWDGNALAGVGGLNVDPYNTGIYNTDTYNTAPYAVAPSIGRVRRLYVRPDRRGKGVGAALLGLIEQKAFHTFIQLNLFTDSSEAASFYEARGYTRAEGERISHFKRLGVGL